METRVNRSERRACDKLERVRQKERRKRGMPLFDTAKVDLPDGEWAEIKELSVGE